MKHHIRLGCLLALALSAPVYAQEDKPLTVSDYQACLNRMAASVSQSRRPLTKAEFEALASVTTYRDEARLATRPSIDPILWWDALAATTDEQRVLEGREFMLREASLLSRLSKQYGVPKEILTAVYGIESDYGKKTGTIPILDVSLSLACLDESSPSLREQAYTAVRLVRDKKLKRDELGSWAGAFGKTQFIPTTFEEKARDGDGDGVADVVGSVADALASTANHLSTRGGWIAGTPVFVEVAVPRSFQRGMRTDGCIFRDTKEDRWRTLQEWADKGWRPADSSKASADLFKTMPSVRAYRFAPVGLPGPSFLVTKNFDAIFGYNNSSMYVMEVALLAQKLAGGADFSVPWPTIDVGLSRAEIRTLQEWLVKQNYDDVKVDGIVGPATRDAIQKELMKRGRGVARRVGRVTMAQLMAP